MTLPKSKPRACAECRRLKLRCDRNFPCQACVRRGCSSICPDKCFTDKPTPSALKANTLRSREQIQDLEARIAALEKALAQENPTHTLISAESSPSLESADEDTDGLEGTTDILGTLAITEDGSTVFHCSVDCPKLKDIQGPLNHSEPPFLADSHLNLPSNLQLLSALFPFTPRSVASAADPDDFLPFLPPAAEALELIIQYWRFCGSNAPIDTTQFMTHVYDVFYPNKQTKSCLVREDSHLLGLLFITLAMGASSDTDNLTLSNEAERYHQLSRAALSLDPVCDNTTVPALQCMLSINWYNRIAPTHSKHSYDWAFHGVTLKLASSIGIFRDSRKWITESDEIQQREILCWELICTEIWMAFAHGRPSSVDLSLVDCPYPTDAINKCSRAIPGFQHWKYSFFSLINKVLLVVLRPKPVRYSEVLALEQQLRECSMPPVLEVPLHGSPLEGLPDDATSLHMQRFMAMFLRETTSCTLHRRFLLLAMENESVNLHDAPFRYSVLRAANSARWIITSQIIMYRRYPKIISRVPISWSSSFSAAIILGAISARYTDRQFAECTLIPFESICALFAETAGKSLQPPHALESLKRLHKRVKERVPYNSISQSCPLATNHSECFRTAETASKNEPQLVMAGTTSYVTPEITGENLGSVKASNVEFPTTYSNIMDPMAAAWPAFDPTYPSEDGDIMQSSQIQQQWKSWPDGDVSQFDGQTIGQSIEEVEQWNQFLDNLGV